MKKNGTSPLSKTFLANLHPLAARFNLKPHLSNVTLANVLAGDTCAPISLTDFERHLTFVEYSVENLQFLVWFQDYRERYLKLTCGNTSPIRDNFVFNAPSRAVTEQRAQESLARLEQVARTHVEDKSLPTSPTEIISPRSSPMLLALPQLAYTAELKANEPESTVFRTECVRAVATFLSPGSVKELPLDAIIRDTAIRNLSLNCHPDVFLPVYEEIYNLLERVSLPRFLSTASANINLPKQIYWYIVGLSNIVVGILIALLLIMILPTPPNANRAWRIFSVGFCSLGSAQCYSAWRGYCSQVWMRGNTQLRVWEMQDMDTEAKVFVSRIMGPQNLARLTEETGQALPSTSYEQEQEETDDKQSNLDAGDVAMIAPFVTIEPLASARRSPSSDAIDVIPSYGYTTARSTSMHHHFHRPPVFGPETVVLDPRIKAVHRQLMFEVCRFGLWVMLAFSALIFAVPSRLHS